MYRIRNVNNTGNANSFFGYLKEKYLFSRGNEPEILGYSILYQDHQASLCLYLLSTHKKRDKNMENLQRPFFTKLLSNQSNWNECESKDHVKHNICLWLNPNNTVDTALRGGWSNKWRGSAWVRPRLCSQTTFSHPISWDFRRFRNTVPQVQQFVPGQEDQYPILVPFCLHCGVTEHKPSAAVPSYLTSTSTGTGTAYHSW